MTIKAIAFSFLLLAATSGSSFSQQSATATTPQQAIILFFEGFAELNDSKMRQYLTADFLLLEEGLIWNTDSLTTIINRRKGTDFKRINSFRFIRTEEKDGIAVVAYHNRADVIFKGQPRLVQWLESAHLVKDGSGWKIKLLHSTGVEPEKQ